MPPLVLALTEIGVLDPQNPDEEKLLAYINENSENVLILDGLQRTYTLIDADDEMKLKEQKEYEKFLNNKLRLEIYVEINKFGILYRMLTLNTGQTPMSARHQLEMLYSNMLDTEIDGVRLITDKEGKADPDENEFIFKNAIEGFNSYMNRNELPLDRQDILDNVKVLEHMADENIAEDLFKEFLETYIKIFTTFTKNHRKSCRYRRRFAGISDQRIAFWQESKQDLFQFAGTHRFWRCSRQNEGSGHHQIACRFCRHAGKAGRKQRWLCLDDGAACKVGLYQKFL